MKKAARTLWRIVKGLPLALLSPIFIAAAVLSLAIADLVAAVLPRRRAAPKRVSALAASIVIPTWNGKDLLAKYLPSVVAALAAYPESEIIVVDNASGDGTAAFLAETFPSIRVLVLEKNLGFGGGSNAGFHAARHDIVVLLNNDMRVDPAFLTPLLEAFTDEKVFAVGCQIFFSDPNKLREETGLTETWWQQGSIRVRHRNDDAIREAYPCAYPGGGSSAFDRRKFLELGGFDELLAPFYMEDTDLGYMAWKRGWKVLYQPASVVFHEHRGTIGRRFSNEYIQSVLRKNFLLFTWKNFHDWSYLGPHFAFAFLNAGISWLFGDSPERTGFGSLARAALQLPGAFRSRLNAKALAEIADCEALRRPLGGNFRDAFVEMPPSPSRLHVLFVSPYPICPPIHGGGVFMYQTVHELSRLIELHLIILLDFAHQRAAHAELEQICATVEYVVRLEGRQKALGSPEPHAAREFRNADLAWLIHRQILLEKIDVLQLEYMVMGQYAGRFRLIPSVLFEHDVYFQSIARRLPYILGLGDRANAAWEYLRSLRYELRLLAKPDRIQVCSRENREYLESFLPSLRGRIDDGFRAGVDTSLYNFRREGREPFTMLFLGSFRHLPNQEALIWFVRHVLPLVRAEEPRSRLIVIGSDPPSRHILAETDAIELAGFVEDVREPLGRYAVFVCPILAGSGVRVKLLEAFAAGIPVVSTRIGAEGLADKDGDLCALADAPAAFAQRTLELFRDPVKAAAMAERARADVVAHRDMRRMTESLVTCYRDQVRKMRDARE